MGFDDESYRVFHFAKGYLVREDDYKDLWTMTQRYVEKAAVATTKAKKRSLKPLQLQLMALIGKMFWPGDSLITFSDPCGSKAKRCVFHESHLGIAMDLYSTVYEPQVDRYVEDDDMRDSLLWEKVEKDTARYFGVRVSYLFDPTTIVGCMLSYITFALCRFNELRRKMFVR